MSYVFLYSGAYELRIRQRTTQAQSASQRSQAMFRQFRQARCLARFNAFALLGDAAIGVPGGVADGIRLGLNNTTAGDAFRQLPHQYLVNETAGERDRINRQLRASEQMAILTAPGFRASAQPIARAKAPARTDRRNTGSRGPPSHRGTP